jgi:adenylate cyclase
MIAMSVQARGVNATATTVLRDQEAKRNEELVLAESALTGERRVAWVRVAMVVMFGLSQELVARIVFGQPAIMKAPRVASVAFYIVFAISTLIALRRITRPNPRAALWVPFLTSVIDFGFLTLQGWFSWVYDHRVWPEMGAISMAIVLAFSVARYSWMHVVFSTVLACAGFVTVGITAHALSPIATPFVLAGFVAMGILIGMTNWSVHRMFTACAAGTTCRASCPDRSSTACSPAVKRRSSRCSAR